MSGVWIPAMEFGLDLEYSDGSAALVVLKMGGVRNWYGKESGYQGDIRRARLHCSGVTVPLNPSLPFPWALNSRHHWGVRLSDGILGHRLWRGLRLLSSKALWSFEMLGMDRLIFNE